MFLYIDLIIITTLVILSEFPFHKCGSLFQQTASQQCVVSVAVGHTDAYPSLSARKPQGSLMSVANIVSLLLHIIFVVVFQALAYLYLASQQWFVS